MSVFEKIISEINFKRIFNKRYKTKPILEIVRKIEEFRHKKLESEKRKDPQSVKYDNYIEALSWVIYADSPVD